ncbi:TIGR02611 family protein [Modestobacter sp. NPDC049651]|uniref:TIGR02611 family protein n=1 Tax=unclassified Modestobacter TaxID=2643866 RepID=UPI003410D7C6
MEEHVPHGLRERVADTQWRRRLARSRTVDTAYRVAVGVVGAVVVAFGLVTIPLPGPGWLTVIAGLFVLATEFTWAERLLEFTRRNVRRWTEWLGRQPLLVRLAVGLVTLAFVVAALEVALHVLGVPGWVPGWVPLWR